MESMTCRPNLRSGYFLVLLPLVLGIVQGCSASEKDPFTVTAKNVNQDINASDVGYIDDGYEWGLANLGFMLNGHGLPDQRRTFVVMHRMASGKTEIVWPVFNYGNGQANAEVLDHSLVFMALLPDSRRVLMAHRAGENPLVISPAVLRLAAQRLGTSVIVPGTDYVFTKVRQPPGRIWLKGQPASAAEYNPQGVFTLELTAEDLRKVIDETRRKSKLCNAKKFTYLAEEGAPNHISAQDATDIGATATPAGAAQIPPLIRKITGYAPRNEDLNLGDVLWDAVRHYAYYNVTHEPGRILKVSPGNDSKGLPTVVGVAVLEGEEDRTFHSVIDAHNGYAYFGTDFPGHIVKVALGGRNTPPYRVGSVLIDKDWNLGAGVLDAAQGVGCFQVGPRFIKFRLGKGDEPPAMVSQTEFPKDAGVVQFNSVVFDPATHYAYFGCDLAEIYKVAIGDGDAPPRFVGVLKLPLDEFGLRGALIDPTNRFAWFTSQNGRLVKIALGAGDSPPMRIGALNFGSKYQYTGPTFGLDNLGYAYLGSGSGGMAGDPECCTGGVLKIALGTGDELPRIVSVMPLTDAISIDGGFVDPENRTLLLGVTEAGAGCKLMKLRLGEGDAPPTVIEETKLYVK
jgi:hypothetical protein